MRRALLSVSDKTGVVDFARGLAAGGFEIVSTGGTARALADAGVAVTQVSSVTGFPEMMDGRVKTLHPAVHAGILARRDRPGDLRALEAHGIRPIDVVAVNLYPFARAAADPGAPVETLVEEIDIGGPTLVRAAAKNFRDVVVVVDPGDYPEVLEALRGAGGPGLDRRLRLARKAFAHTASYDGVIASTLSAVEVADGRLVRGPAPADDIAPDALALRADRLRRLRYGENPHQAAALYAAGGAGFGGARVVQGKPLSFTNLLDLDAAARLTREFDEPAAVVVKHTNPCGAATAGALCDAYVAAREVDPLSAFGGIVGLNRRVDGATAAAIASTFVEAVVAPDADDEARARPRREEEPAAGARRLLPGRRRRAGPGGPVHPRRPPRAGRRPRDGGGGPVDGGDARRPESGLRVVTRRPPTGAEWAALRLAWRVCAHVKSNAVVFARPDRLAAIGAGQMSRVDAVKVAVMKASGGLTGTAAASERVLPVPRRPRRGRRGRRHGGGPARGSGAGRGGHRRRRRARSRPWCSRGGGTSGTDRGRRSPRPGARPVRRAPPPPGAAARGPAGGFFRGTKGLRPVGGRLPAGRG